MSRSLLKVTLAGVLAAGSTVLESVQVPFNADLTDTKMSAVTAPTGSDFIIDIKNGATSLFGAVMGTLRTALNSTDTSSVFDFLPKSGSVPPEINQVILMGTEKLLVTAVQGSQATSGSASALSVTATRGYDGSTKATHAVGINVSNIPPFIADGAKTTGVLNFPGATPLNADDVLNFTVTQVGSSVVGGVPLDIILELTER